MFLQVHYSLKSCDYFKFSLWLKRIDRECTICKVENSQLIESLFLELAPKVP